VIPSPNDRITKGGKKLTRRVWSLLEAAGKEAGVPIRVMQGSWSGSVSASAGTHSGGGAFDLSVRGMTASQQLRLIQALRKRGAVSWIRNPKYGWGAKLGPAHIHGIVRDEAGLSYGAKRQVINYNNGQNGLAGHGKDPFPQPEWHPYVIPGTKPPIVVPKHVAVKLANLQYGKRNDDVKDLQRALKMIPDGYYGPVTDKAVRAHQKSLGFTPDKALHSYVGPKQAKALGLDILV
jgi:hypothetical protein